MMIVLYYFRQRPELHQPAHLTCTANKRVPMLTPTVVKSSMSVTGTANLGTWLKKHVALELHLILLMEFVTSLSMYPDVHRPIFSLLLTPFS